MSRRGRIIVGTSAALLAVAFLLAPVITVGYCADATTPAASFCTTTFMSVTGLPTNVWAWAAASIVVLAVGVWIARRRT
ncbi:hypothetical protein M1D46_01570 [Microbacterium sp. JZ70]